MEKKIIAVALVLVLMVTVFTACGKKNTFTLDNGQEVVLATDEEGSTMIDRDGKLVVYVTDTDGDYVTYENGERQTNMVDFPKMLINGQTMETPIIRWTIPEGWTFNKRGMAVKDDTDGNVSVKLLELGSAKNNALLVLYSNAVTALEKQMEEIVKTYPDSKMTVEDTTIWDGTEASRILIEIYDTDGTCIQYTDGYYYEFAGQVYKLECLGGNKRYTQDIDYNSVVNGIEMKDVLTYTTDPDKAGLEETEA